jgi:predicted ATPase
MKKTVFLMSLLLTTSFIVIADDTNQAKINQIIELVEEKKAKKNGSMIQRRYIITGGPCVGKTLIINRLKDLGHDIVREAATDIKEEIVAGGRLEHWTDPELDWKISKCIHERQRESIKSIASLVFFDRGPIDPLAYAVYWNPTDTPHFDIIKHVKEILEEPFYETTVFLIAPLIEELYVNHSARHESREASEKLGEYLAQVYKALGFKIEKVPFGSVEDRAQWILDSVVFDVNSI